MSEAITRLNTALEGRYSIERELGEGGMATVYLVVSPSCPPERTAAFLRESWTTMFRILTDRLDSQATSFRGGGM